MKTNTYYKTLNGDVGKTVALSALHYSSVNEHLDIPEELTLCLIRFDDRTLEWWLSEHLQEVEDININLFEEVTENV